MKAYNFLYTSVLELVMKFWKNSHLSEKIAFFFHNNLIVINLLSLLIVISRCFFDYQISNWIFLLVFLFVFLLILFFSIIKNNFHYRIELSKRKRFKILRLIIIIIYIHLSGLLFYKVFFDNIWVVYFSAILP
jgi:hypothetical protein